MTIPIQDEAIYAPPASQDRANQVSTIATPPSLMLNAYTGTANIAALCHEYTGSAKHHTGIDLSASRTSSPVQKLVLQAGQLIAQPG